MAECGECTLCCTSCKIIELNKPSGITCKHCSTKCDIYKDRPHACKEFSCAYHQMDNVSLMMRPDNLGVVFEKLDNDLMFGTVNTKHKDFKHMNGQINAFLKEGINTVLSKDGIPLVYHLDNVTPESLLKRVHDKVSK